MANQNLPIILAHGIARFDIVKQRLKERLNLPDSQLGDHFEYFKGIKTHLEAHGFKVFHPNQDFAGPVTLRAAQLGDRVNEAISKTGAPKVHIIAHSMGGLDARHMIVDHDMADKVASLTTIGTPHLGTVLADRILNRGGFLLLKRVRQCINLDGFADLTTGACEQFNKRAEDQEARNNVSYQTYASAQAFYSIFTLLLPSWILIRYRDGKNDGLVSFVSQQWKKELVASDGSRKAITQKEFPISADHLNEIGWWDPRESLNPAMLFQNVVKQALEYEAKVKKIYLEIAQSL